MKDKIKEIMAKTMDINIDKLSDDKRLSDEDFEEFDSLIFSSIIMDIEEYFSDPSKEEDLRIPEEDNISPNVTIGEFIERLEKIIEEYRRNK